MLHHIGYAQIYPGPFHPFLPISAFPCQDGLPNYNLWFFLVLGYIWFMQIKWLLDGLFAILVLLTWGIAYLIVRLRRVLPPIHVNNRWLILLLAISLALVVFSLIWMLPFDQGQLLTSITIGIAGAWGGYQALRALLAKRNSNRRKENSLIPDAIKAEIQTGPLNGNLDDTLLETIEQDESSCNNLIINLNLALVNLIRLPKGNMMVITNTVTGHRLEYRNLGAGVIVLSMPLDCIQGEDIKRAKAFFARQGVMAASSNARAYQLDFGTDLKNLRRAAKAGRDIFQNLYHCPGNMELQVSFLPGSAD